jgi:hypothetical protein
VGVVHREVNGGGAAERIFSGPMLIRLALALLIAAFAQSAIAAPARIIILRHGEKADAWKLCEIGDERAKALALNYLGKDAAKSLFTAGDDPAFFFAITLHTLELASPAVATWSKPIILYSVLPEGGTDDTDAFTKALNRRTQEAARNILTNPALNGKTVVMVWEHKHIANEKLEAKFEGEQMTLRQLFKLDILPGVPKTWPTDTYDYFWIVEFPNGSNVPSKFSMLKQDFGPSFPRVPANDWDTPDGLDAASGCKVKSEGE